MNKYFKDGCFSPNWVEVNEKKEDIETKQTEQQRKDLATLLAELEDIKNNINSIEEKQWRLSNLMKFYNNGLVTE